MYPDFRLPPLSESRDLAERLRVARSLSESGRIDESIEAYRSISDRPVANMDRAVILNELGWLIYEATPHRAEALAHADEALSSLSKAPNSSDAHHLRGLCESLRAHCLWSIERM